MTSRCRIAGAGVFVALLPALLAAQTIRGVVVDQANTPIPGVVMQLLDSALDRGRSHVEQRARRVSHQRHSLGLLSRADDADRLSPDDVRRLRAPHRW